MPDKITLEVFRYRPDQEQRPTSQSYEVPYQEDWVVLDALNWIKDQQDGTLSYRWSCRMGVCGSCGMMVNGVPKLTCSAFLRDLLPGPIKVEPLSGFPVERDLVVVLDDFMQKLVDVKPWIIREVEQPVEQGEYRQTPGQLVDFKQYSMCINCALCYAACPVLASDPDFVGPAAIALGHRYNLDSRDEGNAERFETFNSHDGVYACSFANECSQVCPKHVDPAMAIQQAKLNDFMQWAKILPKKNFT